MNKLDPTEDFELDITSYGGSVSAGISICNLLKQASANGHKTISHVVGIAASMASAIACACDELRIDANSFLMVHNPWTLTMGNAGDLRKEADTLDKYRDALLSIYRTKFDLTDETIKRMMDDETWIMGDNVEIFHLDCEVIPTEEPIRIAAYCKNSIPNFLKMPKTLKEKIMETENELKAETEQAENKQNVEPVEHVENVEPVENIETVEPEKTVEEPKVEEPKAEVETVTKAECEKRVSGMQSTMAKQIDSLKKEYEARITDFEIQIRAKDEELTRAMSLVTSLTDDLKNTSDELLEMTSAFQEKQNALDLLNARVLSPAQSDTKEWKKLHGEALLQWCRERRKNH